MTTAKTTVRLDFDPALNRVSSNQQLSDGLSAAVFIGDSLWVASDESVSVERLTRLNASPDQPRHGAQRRFPLADYLPLPVDPNDPNGNPELDIEGMDYRDGYLWLVGSHSARRKRVKPELDALENRARLAKLTRDGNRHVLARIPVVTEDGQAMLVKFAPTEGKPRVAGGLANNAKYSELTERLADDEHLGAFLKIPGKDNGFDIEGLAVGSDGRVFLGLRGPVLRGWAVILELRIKPDKDDEQRIRLGKWAEDGARYRKHFLDLDGLGIRDLCIHGEDLWILAGPSMVLDGRSCIYRWPGGAAPGAAGWVARGDLKRQAELPSSRGGDYPEAMAFLQVGGNLGLLILHDRAKPARRLEEHSLLGDWIPI